MTSAARFEARLAGWARPLVTAPIVRWVALLGLCAAYLQGGLNNATDFYGAVTELNHFGLAPAAPLAMATIVVELGASVLILTGCYRWLGAATLAGFTLFATFLANRFWEMAPPERFMAANAFFEHLGLIGGFLLVAWHDLRERA
jgi:uncharacterized membrane protein YphA (DoxX/SURF4 family)